MDIFEFLPELIIALEREVANKPLVRFCDVNLGTRYLCHDCGCHRAGTEPEKHQEWCTRGKVLNALFKAKLFMVAIDK